MALSKIDADGVTGLQETLTATTTVPSEGGAVTTNLVQGLAKAWMCFNGRNTSSILDSFNYSSMVDNGVGQYTLTLTNAMNNSNYSHSGISGWGTTSLICIALANNSNPATTTVARYSVTYANGSTFDSDKNNTKLHGDLA